MASSVKDAARSQETIPIVGLDCEDCARTLAHDLKPHGVTALALSPGFTRTEAVSAILGKDVPGMDSIEYAGRAVRALFDDPTVGRHSGRTVSVAEVAAEYGFSDIPYEPTAAAERAPRAAAGGRK